jgi:hypothetical protein
MVHTEHFRRRDGEWVQHALPGIPRPRTSPERLGPEWRRLGGRVILAHELDDLGRQDRAVRLSGIYRTSCGYETHYRQSLGELGIGDRPLEPELSVMDDMVEIDLLH